MAFNFRFVAHTADAETVKFTPQRIGNGTANGGFTHPRWADQQHNRTGYFLLKGTNGQKLQNAVFYVVQTGVVFVQHLASLR